MIHSPLNRLPHLVAVGPEDLVRGLHGADDLTVHLVQPVLRAIAVLLLVLLELQVLVRLLAVDAHEQRLAQLLARLRDVHVGAFVAVDDRLDL